MSNSGKYCLDWHTGPGVQLELLSPPQLGPGTSGADRLYQLKYTPPLRTTIRTVQNLPLAQNDLTEVDNGINSLVTAVNARAADPGHGPPSPGPASGNEFQTLGDLLFGLIIADYMANDLRLHNLFVEFGIDEELLGYPWELMHDGSNFLCLRHYLGRFVNSRTSSPTTQQVTDRWEKPFDSLSVLVVAVPKPNPRDGVEYPPLPSAENELDTLVNTLTGIPDVDVKVLKGREATYTGFFRALKDPYHIIHYCGHARVDNASPIRSSLVLHDQSVATGYLSKFVARAKPILCFINACETAMVAAGNQTFNFFGLARAFLDTGAYLLGSRWKINDALAAQFAPAFYTSLLQKGDPLGKAVCDARLVCYKKAPDDFAWASYVLYGDPRVGFRRVSESATSST